MKKAATIFLLSLMALSVPLVALDKWCPHDHNFRHGMTEQKTFAIFLPEGFKCSGMEMGAFERYEYTLVGEGSSEWSEKIALIRIPNCEITLEEYMEEYSSGKSSVSVERGVDHGLDYIVTRELQPPNALEISEDSDLAEAKPGVLVKQKLIKSPANSDLMIVLYANHFIDDLESVEEKIDETLAQSKVILKPELKKASPKKKKKKKS